MSNPFQCVHAVRGEGDHPAKTEASKVVGLELVVGDVDVRDDARREAAGLRAERLKGGHAQREVKHNDVVVLGQVRAGLENKENHLLLPLV